MRFRYPCFVAFSVNLQKTTQKFGYPLKNIYLCTRKCMFVQWCNGSTTGFGSVCGGSNPPWTTNKGDPLGVAFIISIIAEQDYLTAFASSAPALNLATFLAAILIFAFVAAEKCLWDK